MLDEASRGPAVGVHPAATDQSMPLIDLALEVEARGLRSIYLPEHTHIPVGSEHVQDGWVVPDRYKRTLDPFVACSFIAATTSLEVGTAVSLIAQHDAIALAKAVATLDFLSRGRFLLGVGFGYNRPEAADHGFPVRERARVVEETIGLMRALWRDDAAAFAGEFRRVSRSWAWPKPVQPTGPPVLLGARATRRNFERIVSWADGWIPMGSGLSSNDTLETDLRELRLRWRDHGRAEQLQVTCFFQPATASGMAREVAKGAELGVQRMQVFLEDRQRDDALRVLDSLSDVVSRELGR